jgi:hypothetical protein
VFAKIYRQGCQLVVFVTSVLKGIFTLIAVLCIIAAQWLASSIQGSRLARFARNWTIPKTMLYLWRTPSNCATEIPADLSANFEELGEPVVAQIVGRPYTHATGQTPGVPAWAANEDARRHALVLCSGLLKNVNMQAARSGLVGALAGF